MTGLILILLLSMLILAFGVRLLVQSVKFRVDRRAVTIEDFCKAREVLDSVFCETIAIKRIFSSEDKEFISRSGAEDVQRLFLRERKKLAIQWLRMIQRKLAHLMDLHLRLASYTYDPRPKLELKLSAKYLNLIAVSHIVLLLVRLRGPFKASRAIAYTVRASGKFCTIFSLRLERINPTQLGLGRAESLVH
jgi:hypothetical protein